MIGVGLAGHAARRRADAVDDAQGRACPRARWWHWAVIAAPLLPIFGNSFGWIFTEAGRQPWLVFGLMTTSTGVSPSVSAAEVWHLDGRLHPALRACSPSSRSSSSSPTSARGADPFEEPRPQATHDDDAPARVRLLTPLTRKDRPPWTQHRLVHPHRRPVDRLLRPRGLRLRRRHAAARPRHAAPTPRPPRSAAASCSTRSARYWDGNEVWLLTAGGATFAAFPHWYATMFSAFYLPLLLILVALIVRNIGFDYRGKRDDVQLAAPVGHSRSSSARSCRAVPRRRRPDQRRARPADRRRQGVHRQPLHPAQPVRACSAASSPSACPHPRRAVPGAEDRRRDPRRRPPARHPHRRRHGGPRRRAPAGLGLGPGHGAPGWPRPSRPPRPAGGLAANARGREGWAFVGTSVTIALAVATYFLPLFPDVMPSTPRGLSLTTENASSTP